MEFRLEFTPKDFETKINHAEKIFLAGSCFTEQIGSKLAHLKFQTLQNPNGILFNPISLVNSIVNYIDGKIYQPEDLFFHHELWGSWDHHTRFSSVNQQECLDRINASQKQAHHFLQSTDWLLLTLGSSFVYEMENKEVAANCHKVPTDKFNKRLLSVDEIKNSLIHMTEKLKTFNPGIKIIFTISPVRHLRDGFIENNRSKAHLIAAVHEFISMQNNAFYFPAYELIVDDLRDYRFYAEDMVHPNYSATNYVWNKFIKSCIDEPSQQLMKEINIINSAKNHKSFNPTTQQHQNFLKTNFEKTAQLKRDYPYLNVEDELKYFSTND